MKLTIQQLPQHLAKKILPIYLISGDEVILVQDAIQYIRIAAEKAGFIEHIRLAGESDWEKLFFQYTHTPSLFSDNRFIDISLSSAKINSNASTVLQDYAENPNTNTLVVIRTPKLDSAASKTKWVQSIEKNSVIIPIWPIPPTQLSSWIVQRAKQKQISLTKKEADYIAFQTEGNLSATVQEIEKMSLARLTISSDTNEIQHNTIENNAFTVFDLVDATLANDKKRRYRILKNLFETQVEPILILWALTREWRMLSKMFQEMHSGKSLSTLFSQYRIFEKRQPLLREFLQKNSIAFCHRALIHAASIDRMIKGIEPGNAKNELATWVMQ